MGNVLEGRNILFKQSDMALKVGRLTEVNAGCVNTHCPHGPVFGKPAGCLGVQTWKVQVRHRLRAVFLSSQVLFPIGPVGSESCPQQQDGFIEPLIVPALPLIQILDRDLIIRVLGTLQAHVNHSTPADHLSKRYAVESIASLEEVNGRINVSSAMLSRAEPIGRVVISFLRVAGRPFIQLKSLLGRPINGLRIKRMSEVNELSRG